MDRTIVKKILIIAILVLSLVRGSEEKTALVLSGGGARAFAHIGVLKALEEANWYPDIVVGTSMGAIIGALYCCGLDSDEIYSYLKRTRWEEILTKRRYRDIESVSKKDIEVPSIFTLKIDENFDIQYPKYILSTQGLSERLLRITLGPQYYSNGNFDSLAIPLRVVATNIKTGRPVVIKQGNLPRVLTGSAAYPIVLSPVEIDTMLLVDGGLTNNVPCDVAKDEGADFILAVNLSSKISEHESNLSTTAYMDQTINTLAYYSDTRNLPLADLLITPDVENIFSTDFDSIDVLIEIGYKEAKKIISKLKYSDFKPDTDYYNKSVSEVKTKQVRDIHFFNKGRTKKHVMRRELEIKKGREFSLKKARNSVTNIYSTGIFNNVDLTVQSAGPDSIDLGIHLVEKPASVLNFSANYNNEVNASSLISYRMINLFGIGIINNFSMLLNDYDQKGSFDFVVPRIFETILTNSLNFYAWRKFYPLYEGSEEVSKNKIIRFGLNANLGIQVRRIGLTSVGIKQEYVKVEENIDTDQTIKSSKYKITQVLWKIEVDNTNDYDLPTRGNKNTIIYEQSLKNEDLKPYLKLSVTTRNYETYNSVTYSTFLQFGYLSSTPNYFEKFSLGGQNSFPGMKIYEKWGNMIFLSGMSLRFPFTKGIYTNIEMKVGNVWDNLDEFNLTDFNWGIQLGFIIPTPIGPIRADYGADIEQHHMFYFSMGHHF